MHTPVEKVLAAGMKKAPTIPPMMSSIFIPQKPFCTPARPSLLLFTPIIINMKSTKNIATANMTLYTAK